MTEHADTSERLPDEQTVAWVTEQLAKGGPASRQLVEFVADRMSDGWLLDDNFGYVFDLRRHDRTGGWWTLRIWRGWGGGRVCSARLFRTEPASEPVRSWGQIRHLVVIANATDTSTSRPA